MCEWSRIIRAVGQEPRQARCEAAQEWRGGARTRALYGTSRSFCSWWLSSAATRRGTARGIGLRRSAHATTCEHSYAAPHERAHERAGAWLTPWQGPRGREGERERGREGGRGRLSETERGRKTYRDEEGAQGRHRDRVSEKEKPVCSVLRVTLYPFPDPSSFHH